MTPGTLSDDALLARLGTGLLVTRLHYVNGLDDPRRAVLTGMTRDGLLRVEGGRVVGAAHNLRFADAFAAAFERIDGVGSALTAVASHWFKQGRFLCPWVIVRGLTFTGSSR